ncbi:MAG: 50S ribosomal protein L11 methyltransferase [Silvanigrellales bacterium]|nr:50S ribosomal protein L11 methyltransferase [Silvanigrellales bacterium]
MQNDPTDALNNSPDPLHPLCYELRIAVDDARKSALVDLLFALGETAFVEGAVDCDTEVDYDPRGQPSDQYEAYAAGSPVIFYDENRQHLESLRAAIQARMADFGLSLGESAFHIGLLADQNWRESWKASFRPIDIRGVFAILPPWERLEDFPQPHKIVIDPGMAFGTGQHDTTRVCLDMLLDLPPPRCVLDVGTGSGILAIAAALLGARELMGNDIDPESVRTAINNARENLPAEIAGNIVFTEASVAALPALKSEAGFDLIFANIQIKPLMRLAPEILAKATAQTHIVFSGILASEKEEFLAFLDTLSVRVHEVRTQGHWLGILCQIS